MLDPNDGALLQRIDIDFDAGTFRVYEPGPTAATGVVSGVSFTGGGGASVNDFITQINAVLAPGASLSLTDGALSVDGGGRGVAFAQNPDNPADRGGKGFAEYFRLNDVVVTDNPLDYKTGLASTDAHGFTGGPIQFAITNEANERILDVSVPLAGTTVGELVTALNSTATGVGSVGTFAFDGATGALVFTPNAGFEDAKLTVVSDPTQRGSTGLTFSTYFGVGDVARGARTGDLAIRSDIQGDSARLPLGRLDPTDPGFVAGEVVTGPGDGLGALALQGAETRARSFDAAGGLTTTTASVSDYAARLGADVGARAAAADRETQTAAVLLEEATGRRLSFEGVNIEEELIKLSQFQQSFSAGARIIQAGQDLFDTLLAI